MPNTKAAGACLYGVCMFSFNQSTYILDLQLVSGCLENVCPLHISRTGSIQRAHMTIWKMYSTWKRLLLLKGAQTFKNIHSVVLSEGFLHRFKHLFYVFLCSWVCIGFVFLCTATPYCCELTSSRVLPWVACEAGYSACLQPASEPALKLYTCAEKRSRHFSAVCLDQWSLWRYALFESSSVGDLFLGPWLFPSVDTMGPLYLHILLLWDLASYFRQLYRIPPQPCLSLLLHWREMQSNQVEMQWNMEACRN